MIHRSRRCDVTDRNAQRARRGAAFLELVMPDYTGFENAVKVLDKPPQAAVDFMAPLLRKQDLDGAQ